MSAQAVVEWDAQRSGEIGLGVDEVLPRPYGTQWLLVADGEVELDTLGERRLLGVGDAALLRDPLVHQVTAVAAARLVVVDFAGRMGIDLPDPLVAREFASRQGGVVAMLQHCPIRWSQLAQRPSLRSAYGQLLVTATLAEAHADGNQPDVSAVDRTVHTVARAVVDAPERDWTLQGLSRVGLVSQSGLAERFRQAVGTSPMRFVRQARIQRACLLLADPDVSVTQVAFLVGYGSTAAFVRAFRTERGVTPGRWRQRTPGTTRSVANPITATAAAAAPAASAAQSPT